MNELELKKAFISSVKNGHIRYDKPLDSRDECVPHLLIAHKVKTCRMLVRNEAFFRGFDLVIALIEGNYSFNSNLASMSEEMFYNLFYRTPMAYSFAAFEKCEMTSVQFYPVELKSDDDVLDKRLSDQIIKAALLFGKSILVLDKKHSERLKSCSAARLLPATIVGYSGYLDEFEILSIFNQSTTSCVLNIQKRVLTKYLIENGIEICNAPRVYRFLEFFERIINKIVISQIYSHNLPMPEDELELIKSMMNIQIPTDRQSIVKLKSHSSNRKMSEYF